MIPVPEFANWPRCERLLPQARTCVALIEQWVLESEAAARLLDAVAVYLYYRARYTEAEPLCRRSLGISEKARGLDHPDVANSLNNLAGLYYAQGEYPKAAQAFERIIVILERALGPMHPNLGTSMANYAAILTRLDRGNEAATWTARAEAIQNQAGQP